MTYYSLSQTARTEAKDFSNLSQASIIIIYTKHTTYTIENKWENLEQIGEAIFDIPFMIQSHDESMKKFLGTL